MGIKLFFFSIFLMENIKNCALSATLDDIKRAYPVDRSYKVFLPNPFNATDIELVQDQSGKLELIRVRWNKLAKFYEYKPEVGISKYRENQITYDSTRIKNSLLDCFQLTSEFGDGEVLFVDGQYSTVRNIVGFLICSDGTITYKITDVIGDKKMNAEIRKQTKNKK